MTARNTALQRISRRGLISSAVLAGVLSASGVPVAARNRGGVLRLGLSGVAQGWELARNPGALMRVAGPGAVYETLTRIGANGELSGGLAQSWEPIAGGASWLVGLRSDVAFHDGAPLTADDVTASFDRHLATAPLALVGRLSGIERLGPHLLRFDLHEADANFPLLLADPHLIVAREGQPDGIGTGPYRVEEFSPGNRLRLSRVTGDSGGGYRADDRGWFAAIVIRAFPEAERRTEALLADAVDLVDMPASPDRILARRGLRLWQSASSGIALSETALARARLARLPVVSGPPESAVASVPSSYCNPDLGDLRYGPDLGALVPVLADAADAVAAHLPFTLGYNARLSHPAELAGSAPLEGGRLSDSWWFA